MTKKLPTHPSRDTKTGRLEKSEKTVEQRLLDRTTENTKGCWICNYRLDSRGYPGMKVDGKSMRCSRIAYELWVGCIGNKCVCHSCDEPTCINPEHFFLGTNAENSADMVRKGRQARGVKHSELMKKILPKGDKSWSRLHPEKLARGDKHGSKTHPEKWKRGENNGNAKLTEEQVQYIRMWHGEGFSSCKIAKSFGVTKPTILGIIHKRTWKHLPEFMEWKNLRVGRRSCAAPV